MLFKEPFISSGKPIVILLHGGGLSSWSLKEVVQALQPAYHIITPIIEGHGENFREDFVSIEDSAAKLVSYIEQHHSGEVFALGGLSIGAQIVLEALSQKNDIAKNIILESALVCPMKAAGLFVVPSYKLFYGLIQKRWFSKWQAKSLMLPQTMFEQYYSDSTKMSKKSLINISVSNIAYRLKSNASNSKARVLILVGGKELKIMRKSALLLHEKMQNSILYTLPAMKHGELSLRNPQHYGRILKCFLSGDSL